MVWDGGIHLVKEGGSCQHHGELTRVVGVVEPGLVVDVPGVVPPRETHNAIPGLAPHPRASVSQMHKAQKTFWATMCFYYGSINAAFLK